MFGRTFPALECAACILTPKMVAASQHDRIKLLTNSELVQVLGKAGSYRARILKKARYVDEKGCVACGLCSEACPVTVPSAFDAGITTRKAIYLPFQQAVPNSFLVDAANCLYQTNQTCGACARKCPNGCVNLDEKDEVIEIAVGSIVMATGYDVLDVHKIGRYGYGKHPNVLTALEFERLTNDSGPTGGRIVCRTQKFSGSAMPAEWTFNPLGVSPRRIAIIHCVGSRDANHNRYCSQVCCMYSLKFAHLVKEKLPDAVCYEFYIDLRAFGKGYEEFAERIRQEGTFMVRGRSTSVTESGNGLVIRGEDIMSDRLRISGRYGSAGYWSDSGARERRTEQNSGHRLRCGRVVYGA
jgi:heterodisulfide reductase subunit A